MRLAGSYLKMLISNGKQLSFAATGSIVRGRFRLAQTSYKVLRRYHATNHRKGQMRAPNFFLTKKGDALKERAVCQTFQRLRRIAGVARDDGACYQPRLHDLRHTFAVHRLTAWIKRGADLNRMILAISAYIGQVGLGSTDRCPSLTPECFRTQLDRLSPR